MNAPYIGQSRSIALPQGYHLNIRIIALEDKAQVHYCLFTPDVTVAEGDDFRPSPMRHPLSNQAADDLLTLIYADDEQSDELVYGFSEFLGCDN